MREKSRQTLNSMDCLLLELGSKIAAEDGLPESPRLACLLRGPLFLARENKRERESEREENGE